MTAYVDATDSKDTPKLHQAFEVPACTPLIGADGKPGINPDGSPKVLNGELTHNFTVDKKAKIKITFIPSGSDTTFTAAQLVVPDSNSEFSDQRELLKIKNYDKDQTIDMLKDLANMVGAADTEMAPKKLIDLQPELNKILIATIDEKGKFIKHDGVTLTTLKYEHHEPDTIKNAVVTSRDVVAKMSLSVPVYGSIASNMDNNEIYNLLWDVKHYVFTNTITVSEALMKANDDTLKAIKTGLEANEKSSLYYISEMNVIPDAVFSITKGTKYTGDGNAAVASVFTASGSYVFNHTEEKFSTLKDDVISIKYSVYGDRQKVIDMINAKLNKSADAQIKRLINDAGSNKPLPASQNKIILKSIPF